MTKTDEQRRLFAAMANCPPEPKDPTVRAFRANELGKLADRLAARAVDEIDQEFGA